VQSAAGEPQGDAVGHQRISAASDRVR
jgi:hypothetical protein